MSIPVQLVETPRIGAWLSLQAGRVHVRTGRVELGQGNLTALLQIAADELDVDVDQVRISGGDTRQSPNEGFTSGSLSITQSGTAIRWAASAARQALLSVAARRLAVSLERLNVLSGQIYVDSEKSALSYWDVAGEVDWEQDATELAAPKLSDARKVAGKSIPRIDLVDRIAGEPFVHDLTFPGMVFGRLVHPPCMGAKLLSLDMNRLGGRPGVLKVWRNGEITGLIAESTHAANAACEWAYRTAEWDLPENAPTHALDAISQSQEDLLPVQAQGDVSTFDGAMVTHRVSRPYLSHGSIGPSAAIAIWENDRLRIWSHAQGPYPLRDAIATVLGLSKDAIDVIHHPGAGCYGHNGADDVALDAALLAVGYPGRAVKVVWSRADEFRCAPLAPGMVTRVSVGLDSTHTIQAMDVIVNSAPHGNRPGRNGSPNLRAAAFLNPPFPPSKSNDIPLNAGGGADRNAVPIYDIPNVRVQKRIVHKLPYRTSSMRSLGAHLNVYALETLMDKLADDASEDPFEFRLRHLRDDRALNVLRTARDATAELRGRPVAEGCGWGLGFAKYKNTAAYCAVVARVEVQERVRVTDVYSVIDGGEIINPDGVINQTEGGILQALSWTLHEEIKFAGPVVATETWLDYPIIPFSDVPKIEVELIHQPDCPPLGCAEAAQGPMAAAIGNAVFQAIGVHVCDMPLTPDALVSAALNH